MKDKFKKFVRQHWIFIWALLSVVYAAIVQLLFSLKTSNQFLVAHWGAGDILTYASTISLGLLAMWQNKKQQEENLSLIHILPIMDCWSIRDRSIS